MGREFTDAGVPCQWFLCPQIPQGGADFLLGSYIIGQLEKNHQCVIIFRATRKGLTAEHPGKW